MAKGDAGISISKWPDEGLRETRPPCQAPARSGYMTVGSNGPAARTEAESQPLPVPGVSSPRLMASSG